MKLLDIFETRIEEKIDPVIKVGENQDEGKLAAEISAYVVTPTIERYVDEFLEHFTDTLRTETTEIGVWIAGYFGSGKSHLAKILSLISANPVLAGHPVAKRFAGRVPATAPRRDSILRSLSRVSHASTRVLAFNLNTLVDSKKTELPRLLLSQYFQSRGYSSNVYFARVIEQELDRRGKLGELHREVEVLADRPWADIRKNPNYYAKHLYQAACKVAPNAFATPEEVAQALRNAEKGELYNAQLLVRTLLEDLQAEEAVTKKPARVVLVLDESGQWIEDNAGRLAQLQAFVEEAAAVGRGKIWVFVTTHEDMGAIFQNARALQADMKKIAERFRFRWSLTTENIELVLEDRIFKKKIAGKEAVLAAYDAAPGVLRGLGELAHVTGQKLPTCERERFSSFYPFFPYQIHLIPEIVKSLRAKGGRGEQLSGSTRTLLAIAQDVLRAGRRPYLRLEVGEICSFDEIFGNLADSEVSPDVRREISRIEEVVPGASALTRRVAEVLFLIREITYVPRTVDNLARLLVESTSDDLPALTARVQPELDRLIAAKLVARIGDEYEFLTGERRTFEEEVANVASQHRQRDREAGIARHFIYDPDRKAHHLRAILGFDQVPYKGHDFEVRISMDGTYSHKGGDVEVRIFSPLAAAGGVKVADLEDQSLRADEANVVFVLCDRVRGFDEELSRFLAMNEVVTAWVGDPHKSEDAHKLAEERRANDLKKLDQRIRESIREGIQRAHVIFRGSSRALSPRAGLAAGEVLQAELASFWPTIYPKFEKVPVQVAQEQVAILHVLGGHKDLAADIRALRLFDKAGALDPHAPLLDAIRIFLAGRQNRRERTLGKDLLAELSAPPYGWDVNAVRVGVAACVRAGVVKVLVGKAEYTNPVDPVLQKTLRDSREFDRAELVLEDIDVPTEVLEETRTILMKLTGTRKLDETPAALHQAMEAFGVEKIERARAVLAWAQPAGFPLPASFAAGKDALEAVLAMTTPVHRVREIHARGGDLAAGVSAIDELWAFHDKWGRPFTAMRDFAAQLRAVEHLLPAGGPLLLFLGEHEAARTRARFADPDVWKNLQGAKAAAELDLTSLLESFRQDARRLVEAALVRLPADLQARSLDEALAGALAAPLDAFLANLHVEGEPARVAALPDRARRVVDDLGRAIVREAAKKAPPAPRRPSEPPKPARATRRVRLADLSSIRHLHTEAEWDELKNQLDQQVRALLRDCDVELE